MEKSHRDRILQYAEKKYGTFPEYLWDKFPSYAILRHKDNKKWYAAVLNISKDKLGLVKEDKIDILNIKLEPALVDFLVDNKSYFPGYHMNKKNWITIILDGSVSDEEIFKLLDLSFNITKSKSKKQEVLPKPPT